MLTYLAIGLVLGVATGVPIGLVNVAVIEGVRRRGLGFALGIALGGGIADSVHSWLAIAGVGPFLDRYPAVPPLLFCVSGVVICIYGVVVFRASSASERRGRESAGRGLLSGVLFGLLLTLPNLLALLAWVVVAGALFVGVDMAEGTMVAVGVGVGSACWFGLLAGLGQRGAPMVHSRFAVLGRRVLGACLVVLGLASFGRGLHYMIINW